MQILDPDDEIVEEEDVETEAEITHTAEQSGVYTVGIFPLGTASYEIYIED